MRSNCSLYVDAGYLLASVATRVTGTSLRNGIHVEYGKLVQALILRAEEISGLPVLRVHWYDSAKNGVPDPQQERIGELPKVKLRLGRFGVDGQQKGVDLRIGLDLVAHARNGASEAFLLLSGDDDLTEAVEEAQVHGVEVVVLAVPDTAGRPHGVSRHLVRAADELALLAPEMLDSSVMRVETPAPEPLVEPLAEPGAGQVEAGAPRPMPRPSAPTPHDLLARRRAPTAGSSSVLAYSGTTGGESRVVPGYAGAEDYEEQIDGVVRNVVESVGKSASAGELDVLRAGRPSIPRDVDRALLLDLSNALGVYDLNDSVRFRLRERFWEVFEATE